MITLETVRKNINETKMTTENKSNESPKTTSNSSKWLFQNPSEMIEFITKEKATKKSHCGQIGFVLRKLNCCMMYYLMKECKRYKFLIESVQLRENFFLFISEIIKDDEVIFNIEEELKHVDKNKPQYSFDRYQRKFQILKMANLIKKESGIRMIFNESVHNFQLIYFYDKDKRNLSLIEFVEKSY